MTNHTLTLSKEANMAASLPALRRQFPLNCVIWNKVPLMTRAIDGIVAGHYRAMNGELFLKVWDGVSDGCWTAPPAHCQRKPLKVKLGQAVQNRREWAIARDKAGRGGTPDKFAMAYAREHGSAVLIEASDEAVMWARKSNGHLQRKALGPVSTV